MEDVAEVIQQDAGALRTAVFSGLEILCVSSEIHGQHSTIGSLWMLISVAASNNKEVEVPRLQWHYTSAWLNGISARVEISAWLL